MKKFLTRAQAARLRCQLNANSWRGESRMVRVQKSKAETALERLTTSRSDGCARDKRIFPRFAPEFHLSDTDVSARVHIWRCQMRFKPTMQGHAAKNELPFFLPNVH